MRYIMFEDFSGRPVPFIFPDRVEHDDMREQMPYTTVLSAGDVFMENGVFKCSGHASTLSISPRQEDAAIINAFFAGKN